jgi:hypothetical protein
MELVRASDIQLIGSFKWFFTVTESTGNISSQSQGAQVGTESGPLFEMILNSVS